MPTLAQYLMMNPSYGIGQEAFKTGSSIAPVRSPLEGLARALQGVAGGYIQGEALRSAKEQQAGDVSALYEAINKMGTDPTALAGLLKEHPMLAEDVKPFMTAGIGLNRFDAATGGGKAAPIQQATAATGSGVNPFNIGNVRSPTGGFVQPASLEEGVKLAVNNAKAYPAKFNNGQPMNLLQIGQKWAPVGDGANDPVQWAKNVASVSGLDPTKPLDLNDPATAAAFARGVHGAEHGAQAVQPPEVYAKALSGDGTQVAQAGPVAAASSSGPPVIPFEHDPADVAHIRTLVPSIGVEKATEMLNTITKEKTAAKQAAATAAWTQQQETERMAKRSNVADIRDRAAQLNSHPSVATVYRQLPLITTVNNLANMPATNPSDQNHRDGQLLLNAAAVIAPNVTATSVEDLKKESGLPAQIKDMVTKIAGRGTLTPQERQSLVEAANMAHENAKSSANSVIKEFVKQTQAANPSARPEMFHAPFPLAGQGQPTVTDMQPQSGPRMIQAGPGAAAAPKTPSQHGFRFIGGKWVAE